MKFAINPPNTPIVTNRGFVTPEWYRYLVQQRKQGDDITDSDVLTLGPAQEVYPNSRALAVTSGELTRTTDDTDVTLGLADTAVTPDSYGTPTRILVLAIDAKGRVTSAQEIKIDVSDVDGVLLAEHGGTGLDSYTVGDLLVADTPTSLVQLPDVATGNVLLSGGVATSPLWGKVDLTAHVDGILPVANGGTGMASGGFSGTGAYTNFTFANGICTSAS